MRERSEPKAPKQDSPEGRGLKHGEDYGSRGLHSEAGTTKGESVTQEGGITKDEKAGSDHASKGRPATPGQSPKQKDAIAGHHR